MNFLDDSLLPENQGKLVNTAAFTVRNGSGRILRKNERGIPRRAAA